MATAKAYMRSEPRYTLTSAANSALVNPLADDAGNWTGCSPGNGNLVGTHRDLSACMASYLLGRPVTATELGSYTREDVEQIFGQLFNQEGFNQIPNQDIANIAFHIRLHFGNVMVVQRALNNRGANLNVDGDFGNKTLAELRRQTLLAPAKTYNAIRAELEETYMAQNPRYRQGFLNALEHFPYKNEASVWIWATAIILVLALAIYLIFTL